MNWTWVFILLGIVLWGAVVFSQRRARRPGSMSAEQPALPQLVLPPATHPAFVPLATQARTTTQLIDLSRHPNGHEREAAVRMLGARGDISALSALLERVNDWVPQVRTVAVEAIEQLLVPANVDGFMSCLHQLDWIKERRRADHAPLVTRIENFLGQPENRERLFEGLWNDDRSVRQACLWLCASRGLLDSAELVRFGLSSIDLWARRLAATKLHDLDPEALRELLPIALKDRYMPLRREALFILAKNPANRTSSVLTPWLFDRHPAVRDLALTYCQNAHIDAASVYRTELEMHPVSVRRTTCALLGLAALRDESALPEIQARTNSAFPGIRRAALAALAWSPPVGFEELLFRGLLDPSPAVARTAKVILSRTGSPPDIERLLEIALHVVTDSSFRACLALARIANKWDQLGFLLGLIPHFSDSSFRSATRRRDLVDELQRWNRNYNQSQTALTAAESVRIAALLSAASAFIPDPLAQTVAFTLRAARLL